MSACFAESSQHTHANQTVQVISSPKITAPSSEALAFAQQVPALWLRYGNLHWLMQKQGSSSVDASTRHRSQPTKILEQRTRLLQEVGWASTEACVQQRSPRKSRFVSSAQFQIACTAPSSKDSSEVPGRNDSPLEAEINSRQPNLIQRASDAQHALAGMVVETDWSTLGQNSAAQLLSISRPRVRFSSINLEVDQNPCGEPIVAPPYTTHTSACMHACSGVHAADTRADLRTHRAFSSIKQGSLRRLSHHLTTEHRPKMICGIPGPRRLRPQ